MLKRVTERPGEARVSVLYCMMKFGLDKVDRPYRENTMTLQFFV